MGDHVPGMRPHRLRAGLIFKCKGANPLIAAADGIRTVAVELALILAYASVVETFNLVASTAPSPPRWRSPASTAQ